MDTKITKEMTINQIIDMDSELSEIFFSFGMFCIGCAMAQNETLEEACQSHGVDVDALTAALNEAVEDKN